MPKWPRAGPAWANQSGMEWGHKVISNMVWIPRTIRRGVGSSRSGIQNVFLELGFKGSYFWIFRDRVFYGVPEGHTSRSDKSSGMLSDVLWRSKFRGISGSVEVVILVFVEKVVKNVWK